MPDAAPSRALPGADKLNELVRRGDPVAVIRWVERRAESGELDRESRLAEARAFLQLRQMDRAWVRLRELTESNADDAQAWLLTAELFVERGWPARARKVLERLQEGPRRVDVPADLGRRSLEPPVGLPADHEQLERGNDSAALLRLAELHLATGGVLKAQALLERLRRSNPANSRVIQLLWGIRGDFTGRGQKTLEMMTEVPAGEPTVSEHRRVQAPAQPKPPVAEQGAGAFPSLFRRPEAPSGPDGLPGAPLREDDEVTASAVMASAEELQQAPAEESTGNLPGRPHEEGGDTQIMQVITKGGGPVRLQPLEGPAHARPAPAPEKRQPLDLRAWQESMGVKPTALPTSDPVPENTENTKSDYLEDEDQGLVVMTRREEGAPGQIPDASRRGPIEVIEKVPVPEPLPAGMPGQDEVTPPSSPSPISGGSLRGQVRWLLLAAALFLALAVVAGAGIFAFLRRSLATDLVATTHASLLLGDPAQLTRHRDALERSLAQEGWQAGLRHAELALTEASLWVEHRGPLTHRDSARKHLREAEGAKGPDEEVYAAAMMMALGEGELNAAEVHSRKLDAGDLASALRLRLALEQGRAALLPALRSSSGALLAQTLEVRRRLAAGQGAAAEALAAELLGRAAERPDIVALAHEEGWAPGTPDERARSYAQWREGHRAGLRPAEEARLLALEAQYAIQAGRHVDAGRLIEAARSMDPNGTSALFLDGTRELRSGRPGLAAARYGACLQLQPADLRCRRGLIVAMADQEQVEAAVRRSRVWEEQGGLAGPLVALALLASEQPSEAVAAAKAFLDAHGDSRDPALRSLAAMSWYVVGRAAGEAGDEVRRVEPALEQARATLTSTGDPLDQLLAQRALASAALWGDPGRAAERREAVQADAPVDPAAGVLVALSLDRAGQLPAARSAMEKAARGSIHPWVQFQHGLFYYQSDRDMARARQIWRTFLEGRPTGRRAEKAAEALR